MVRFGYATVYPWTRRAASAFGEGRPGRAERLSALGLAGAGAGARRGLLARGGTRDRGVVAGARTAFRHQGRRGCGVVMVARQRLGRDGQRVGDNSPRAGGRVVLGVNSAVVMAGQLQLLKCGSQCMNLVLAIISVRRALL